MMDGPANFALDLPIAGCSSDIAIDHRAGRHEMLKYKVTGMTCGHCAQAVTRAVEAVPSVARAVVDLARGEVAVDGAADRDAAIRGAIVEAGYEVERLLPAD